jgi:hypothetical protein
VTVCGEEPPPDAIEQGWRRLEVLADDGDTIQFIPVCPKCLTEAEEVAS